MLYISVTHQLSVMRNHSLFYVLTLSAKKYKQTFAGMKVFCMLFVVLVSQVYTSVKNCSFDALNDVNFISKVDLLI